MILGRVDTLIIIAYMVGLLCFGIYLNRRSSKNLDEYYAGSRKIPSWVLAFSGMTSNFDITGTMVMTSFFLILGMKGYWVAFRAEIALCLPFLFAFLGKWLRRGKVITTAELMEIRFGSGRDGEVARMIRAIAAIVFCTAMLSYFSVGVGKFFSEFFPLAEIQFAGFTIPRETQCAALIISIGLVYTVLGGLKGVVYSDVFQGIIIAFACIYFAYLAFTKADIEVLRSIAPEGWLSIRPKLYMDMPEGYEMYNVFGLCITLWILKAVMESAGTPVQPYFDQRYFSASSDKECALLSLGWSGLYTFRWFFIFGLVILTLVSGYGAKDPEMALPIFINTWIPVGIKGIIIVALLGACMSTFDSTLNAGTSYCTKDIYQRYVRKDASDRELVYASYGFSIILLGIALGISSFIPNINTIWSWIVMGLTAGLCIPEILIWYWPRFNGWGSSIGTLMGMISAVVLGICSDMVEYIQYPIIAGLSLTGCVLGSYLTKPTSREVLDKFYSTIRPFGFWKTFSKNIEADRRERNNAIINLSIALPWQLLLYLIPFYLLLHQWEIVVPLVTSVLILSILLFIRRNTF